jgi:hypothetical protein
MNEPKPFASLSSGLLARKGQAKPAMRPQGFASFGTPAPTGMDDLGWNDMGHDRTPAQIGLSPMDADIVPFNAAAEAETFAPVEPVVFQQREDIERSFEPEAFEPEAVEPEERTGPVLMTKRKAKSPLALEPAAPEPVAFEPAPEPAAYAPPVAPTLRAAPGSKARAAFTLRLDHERHLKLRLAAAVTHRSAQLLVIEALDEFLANNPALAGITLPAAN